MFEGKTSGRTSSNDSAGRRDRRIAGGRLRGGESEIVARDRDDDRDTRPTGSARERIARAGSTRAVGWASPWGSEKGKLRAGRGMGGNTAHHGIKPALERPYAVGEVPAGGQCTRGRFQQTRIHHGQVDIICIIGR